MHMFEDKRRIHDIGKLILLVVHQVRQDGVEGYFRNVILQSLIDFIKVLKLFLEDGSFVSGTVREGRIMLFTSSFLILV